MMKPTHFLVKVKNPIPPTRRPTRQSTHHRHTTDALANTLPTRWSAHYRRVGWHTTDALVDTLPTHILTRYWQTTRVSQRVGGIGFLTFTHFSQV